MLDRARATSLALLGATAAVGLGIVALALNQGWPLLEGSPIPSVPRQEVGRAAVVSRPAGSARRSEPQRRARAHPQRKGVPARRHATAEAPAGNAHAVALTVSEEAPASPPGSSPKTPAAHGKQPHGPSQPVKTAAPPSPPAPGPPASTSPSASTPTSIPAPAPAQPEAVASEAPPEESNVPPWSSGSGHAYGRGESWHDGGSDEHGDGDGGWNHGGGDWQSHGYGD